MAEMSANFNVKKIEALWRKINTTYRFDSAENRSVTCSAFDDGAEYSMQFKMTESQAKELYKEMVKSFKAKKVKGWPEKIKMLFAKEETGM